MLLVVAAHRVAAHDTASIDPPPAISARTATSAAPQPGVELRFADFFKRPVGPAGLEPGERLLALAGQRVRIVGYMAAAALPMRGRIVLAPVPVELGDEDEHLADDLPPQAVFVHLSGPGASAVVPNYRGLLALTGRLEVGPREEPDGHVSAVRLMLDADASQRCLPVDFRTSSD